MSKPILLIIYTDERHEEIAYYLNPMTQEKFNNIPKGYKVINDKGKEVLK